MEDMSENLESPGSTGSEDSLIVGEEPVLPLLSETEYTEIEACITSETCSTGSEDSLIVGEEPVLPLLSETENTEIEACITSETETPSIPVHAFRTIMLLETPPVQDVIESIANDQNVRNAVMQNEALQEFLRSQNTSAPSLDVNLDVNESAADNEFNEQEYPMNSEDSSHENQSENIGSGFMEMLQNIKLGVVDMASNMHGFIQNIFRTPAGEKDSADIAVEDASTLSDTSILGVSVMGLAALIIVMAVLKKN